MKNAYVIGHITVKNEDKWTEYRNKVSATLEQWDAELIFIARVSIINTYQTKSS